MQKLFCHASVVGVAVTVLMTPAIAQEETILLVELAQSATISDGVLTLHGVDDTVLWFSDRPIRDTGEVALATLIEAWGEGEDSFADDPPNAVLTGMGDEEEVAIVVELTEPSFEDGALSFGYVALADDRQGEFTNVSLFIDGQVSSLF